MIRPLVKPTSSRIWDSSSPPAGFTASGMYLVQISRSLSDFLSSPGMCTNIRQLKALGAQNTPFPARKHHTQTASEGKRPQWNHLPEGTAGLWRQVKKEG